MKKTLSTPELPSSEALFRYQLVSQVLTREATGKKRAEAIKEVADQTHWLTQGKSRQVSCRTLYRWMASFDKTRFSGLTPANRQKITGSQVLPETLLAFFKEQKELDAKTSIPDLILRAEEYHLIDSADSIDRTTVWRALKRDGVSTHRGKSSKQDRDSRRFACPTAWI